MEHECSEGNDPRHKGVCVKCGRVMSVRPRDLRFERTFVREAGKRIGMDTDAFGEFRERRAGEGPVREFSTRDFRLEVREELVDAANYLAWWSERSQHEGFDSTGLFAAMQHVLEAYRLVVRYPG